MVHCGHMRIIFFDTETTGKESTDKICQLAAIERGSADSASDAKGTRFNELFHPGKDIPFEASAVHHISNKMIAGKPLFTEWPDYQNTKTTFESPDTIMVAHNAQFDLNMLSHDNIVPARHICTLKVVRHLDNLDPANKRFSNYKLQYLRYALGMELDVGAHDALADVIVLEQLFAYLLDLFAKQGLTEEQALAEMERISSQPSLMTDIGFGKYRGKTVAEVAQLDPGYLKWLLDQKLQNPDGEEDWIHTLRHYLKK